MLVTATVSLKIGTPSPGMLSVTSGFFLFLIALLVLVIGVGRSKNILCRNEVISASGSLIIGLSIGALATCTAVMSALIFKL